MKKSLVVATILILAIMGGCKRLPDLGNGYRIDYSGRSGYTQIESANNEIIIGDNILNYNYDSNFIIVEQKPVGTIPEKENYADWEVAYNKSSFRQYWIIKKNQKPVFDEKSRSYSNVYGPFKKQEYLNKLEQLKVPKELKLEEKHQ